MGIRIVPQQLCMGLLLNQWWMGMRILPQQLWQPVVDLGGCKVAPETDEATAEIEVVEAVALEKDGDTLGEANFRVPITKPVVGLTVAESQISMHKMQVQHSDNPICQPSNPVHGAFDVGLQEGLGGDFRGGSTRRGCGKG
ncbi:hypothetical protein ACOSQ2_013512 [Xanthoceras sorbifolium]